MQIVDPGTTEIEELRLKIACSHLRNQGLKMDRVGFGYDNSDFFNLKMLFWFLEMAKKLSQAWQVVLFETAS